MNQAARGVLLLFIIGVCHSFVGQSGSTELLRLETTIPLPDVHGRIDHMSIDLKGQRLFVAALGNNSLEVIDLKINKRVQTVRGLAEPQGTTYVPASNRVFVANRKDGSVRTFDASAWKILQSLSYGNDADNLRVDPSSGHLWVGYGDGALGEFDQSGTKLVDIKLGAHPESFQLERNGTRIFVNLPQSRKIAVVDRKTQSVLESWGTGGPLLNYPMALDERDHRLFVVTRLPARLIVLDTQHGKHIATLPTIGDCDDVFYDEPHRRIYAIGGEGRISVYQQRDSDHYEELGRIKTVGGARTGFFSAELDRLYVAVRERGSQSAEIRIYMPKSESLGQVFGPEFRSYGARSWSVKLPWEQASNSSTATSASRLLRKERYDDFTLSPDRFDSGASRNARHPGHDHTCTTAHHKPGT